MSQQAGVMLPDWLSGAAALLPGDLRLSTKRSRQLLQGAQSKGKVGSKDEFSKAAL